MQVMSQLQLLRCLKHKPNSQRKQHSSLRLAEAAAVAVVARAVVVLKGTADQQMGRLQVLVNNSVSSAVSARTIIVMPIKSFYGAAPMWFPLDYRVFSSAVCCCTAQTYARKCYLVLHNNVGAY